MKDIESRLGDSKTLLSSPRRPLSDDFTARTMQQLDKSARRGTWGRLTRPMEGIFPMHKLSKTAALLSLLAVTAVTAGTSLAAIQWLKPEVNLKPDQTITLPNGNRIVTIDIDTCPGQSLTSPWRTHYEIKAGSKVTPALIADSLEAQCESDMLRQLFPEANASHNPPKNGPHDFKPGQEQFYFPYATFRKIEAGSLVIDTGLNGEKFTNVRVPIDRDARFYHKGQPIKAEQLKPGSELTLVVHTTALSVPYSTETMRPNEINKISKDGLPLGATIKGAIQHEYNVQEAHRTLDSLGNDWTRVEKDHKAPNGWRQITPLNR